MSSYKSRGRLLTQLALSSNSQVSYTPESRLNAETLHKSHIEMAENARALMKEQFKKANEDESKETECLSFDLEKTLPLPRIPTNIVFYKRQLWLYNCGVHDSQNRGYCYTWVEGNAGRGAQEVGSCLRKHILNKVPHGTKYLNLWSDSCGGQNRNIKITLLMKAILEEHPTLEEITHHFLVPGHSFLKNDSDFSDIECCLKTQQRLYVPEDYIEVMKSCRKKNPLHVVKMEMEDFKSTDKLEEAITNRKKSIDGEPINWLKFKVIQVRKSEPLSIFVKKELKEETFVKIDIGKRTKKGRRGNEENESKQKRNKGGRRSIGRCQTVLQECDKFFSNKLSVLWPQGKPISKEKLQDLKSMYHLIPKDCVDNFYKGLSSSALVQDDIEAFSGTPDFELEF